MTHPQMQTGFVVSDLHLFTERSSVHRYMDRIHDTLADANFLVLNGDTVDFRWTTLPSIEATAHAADDWLTDLCTAYPNCQFYYIMGNHDGLAFFAKHLDTLAEQFDNFHWHESHIRIGHAMFFHGDLPIERPEADPFHRELNDSPRRWSRHLDMPYNLFVHSRLHRATSRIFSPRTCAKRIVRSLAFDHRELADGITDIYFGHIHRPFEDLTLDSLTFHNTGSAIHHLELKLIQVTCDQ
jgi:UDP-2,3-diacylglucosamine pyrophosphatase LpxH